MTETGIMPTAWLVYAGEEYLTTVFDLERAVKLRDQPGIRVEAVYSEPQEDSGEFNRLRRANLTRQVEWQNGIKLSLAFRGNELAGEIGELCNKLKKIEREQLGLRGSRSNPIEAMDEMADGIICLDLIAGDLGYDIWPFVVKKFNETSEAYDLQTRIDYRKEKRRVK